MVTVSPYYLFITAPLHQIDSLLDGYRSNITPEDPVQLQVRIDRTIEALKYTSDDDKEYSSPQAVSRMANTLLNKIRANPAGVDALSIIEQKVLEVCLYLYTGVVFLTICFVCSYVYYTKD